MPVTGNAFRISSYDKTAQTITAVPDPHWWGTRPKLDSIVYRALDYTAWTDAYLSKEIDYASAILPEDYKRLAKAAGTDIRVGARWDEVHIEFNGARGPLKDVRVRQALQHAIDRKAIATAFGKDLPVKLQTHGSHFFMPNQIWALGHSIPLYQRPEVLAVRSNLANYGADGLASRDYTKVGWLK
ncbi:ABC transporter substrate-binding protein [Streptomyces sp. NPDC059629]|uniref:ABC transporter substrate-binding protein n=1 Tax=Streptomyces sp. NPDC059629 TaxID=3346889 RepID=UPI0036D08040